METGGMMGYLSETDGAIGVDLDGTMLRVGMQVLITIHDSLVQLNIQRLIHHQMYTSTRVKLEPK